MVATNVILLLSLRLSVTVHDNLLILWIDVSTRSSTDFATRWYKLTLKNSQHMQTSSDRTVVSHVQNCFVNDYTG